MAEENQSRIHEHEATEIEIKDRGLFDLVGKKKEEKPQEKAIATEFEKVKVSDEHRSKLEEQKEDEESEKKQDLLENLHQSDSSSSFSWDEEEEREKKGLKEKIEEKIRGGDKEEEKHEGTSVPVEKVEVDPSPPEEKKGFLDKIKEKLPGQHKKTEEVPASAPSASAEHEVTDANVAPEGEAKEKKGIFEKIKGKLPGYHPKIEEEKEKDRRGEAGDHRVQDHALQS